MKIRINKWPLICSTLLFLGLFPLNMQKANAQILIQEGFDETIPAGWNTWSSNILQAPFAPCEGAGSLVIVLWPGYPSSYVVSPVWISNGEDINVSFDFKVLLAEVNEFNPPNVGTPVGPGWGSMTLQLSTDGGVNYTPLFQIDDDNYTSSTSCTAFGGNIDGSLVPDGSFFRLRWFGRKKAGGPDIYMYLDEIFIQQEGFYDCPEITANFGYPCDDGDFYTIDTTIDENCECTGGTTVVFEGCNNGNSYRDLSPLCSGPQVNAPAQTRTYARVFNLHENLAYEFISSNPDYFVTVTDNLGLTILAYGQGSVNYTPSEDGNYRFYTHTGPDCPDTPGGSNIHTRSIIPGVCDYDCPEIEGYIDDYCIISSSGESFSQTVATTAVDGPTTFEANPSHVVSVPSGLTGDYQLTVTVDGAIICDFPRSQFRVQIIDPNDVNITNGAPGGNTNEWQPSTLFGAGPFVGSLNVGTVTDPSGDWIIRVRLNDEKNEQLCAEADITLSFVPGQAGIVNDDCVCIEPSFAGCTTTGFFNEYLNPACGEIASSVDDAYTYEANLVIVTAGDNYVFSLSNPDYYVTVSQLSSSTVLAAGQGSVSLTAADNSQLLFYSHFDEACSTITGPATAHTRSVTRTCIPIFDCPNLFANIGDACFEGGSGQAGIIGDDCDCFVPCYSQGGELTVNGSSTICFEEGSSDPVTFGNAVLTGAAGDHSLWVLTTGSSLSVLATDASGPNFDLSGLAEGLYRIWHVSYTNNVDINEVLGNINTPGCWDASNPVNIVVAYSPVGGTISTNSITTVCTGQGIPSGILATYEGEGAMYLRWVLTDESGTEIGRRAINSLFNFDTLSPGTYRIYHVASATTANNLNSSTNVNDVGPCASVSNFIEVTAIDCSGSAQLTSQPSPTSGISQVSFSVDNGQRVQLEVYDLSGRQISTLFNQDANGAQNYTMQFDGSGLPNGVYIYRMTTESEVIIDKFMIAR